jgi:predicted transposase YdaD
MHYDIAAKVLMEKCRGEILRRFLGLSVSESTLLQELPQETVSLKRSDFPILVTDDSGCERLVLLEIQSQWDRRIPLRLLDYRSRYLLKHDVEVISCILLLRPSSAAVTSYEDNEVRYSFRLIRIDELDARDILVERLLCLMPFVPLMRHGEEELDRADRALYESALSRQDKADMLTAMTIFSGLVSEKLPHVLLSKRRDIMIESAAYDIIKQEGLQEGLQQGMQRGLRQGMIQEAQEGILDILEARFDVVPESIAKEVRGIEELGVLKALRRSSVKVAGLDELRALLKRAKE